VLLLDTYSRMHFGSIFSLTPGRSRAIFLREISVNDLTVKDVQTLKNQVFQIMESALRAYKAEWIEEGENIEQGMSK
jgi:1-acyl-sn-glycerol-3-phosphate acyltransferase